MFRNKHLSLGITTLICIFMLFLSGTALAGKNKKVKVCHNGQDIKISKSALPAHIGHGDFEGDCEDMPLPEIITIKCISDETTGGEFLISHLSKTPNAPDPSGALTCPDAQKLLTDGMCKLKQTFGDPSGQVYSFACPDITMTSGGDDD